MSYDVATPLPDMTLLPGSVIIVRVDQSDAEITQLTLHGFQVDPLPRPVPPPILSVPGRPTGV